MKVVSNTSVLIALDNIGRLELLKALFNVLHKGEAEAIALAMQVKADILLLDDKKARALATKLGLRILGTLGILILAKKKSIINSIEEEIAKLMKKSFWLSQNVVSKALEKAEHDC